MSATITWLGQAGFILKTNGGTVAIDPFCGTAKGISERMYPNDIEKDSIHVDLVLTTHAHWDHFDADTYRDFVIPKEIAGPGTCMAALEKSGLDIPGTPLNRGGSLDRCGLHITATFADHDVDSVGYIVEFEGKKLYFSGDTLFTTRTITSNAGMAPDLTFICINGKLGNMNYFEAASYCKLLGTKNAVPMHYDMIRHNTENPQEFVNAAARVAPSVHPHVLERRKEYDLADLLA